MLFGLGPFRWSFWHPYLQPWYPYYGAPWPSLSKEDAIRMLEDHAMALKPQLERVNQRLRELKK